MVKQKQSFNFQQKVTFTLSISILKYIKQHFGYNSKISLHLYIFSVDKLLNGINVLNVTTYIIDIILIIMEKPYS